MPSGPECRPERIHGKGSRNIEAPQAEGTGVIVRFWSVVVHRSHVDTFLEYEFSSTLNRFPPPSLQRTSGAPPGTHYVGSRVCAQCHLHIAATQPRTAMGQTSATAADSPILAKHPPLKYSDGRYTLASGKSFQSGEPSDLPAAGAG